MPQQIQLPWIDPLALPIGRDVSTGEGVIAYKPPSQIQTLGGVRALAPPDLILPGAPKEVWALACPELNSPECADAISVALGIDSAGEAYAPRAVRLHHLRGFDNSTASSISTAERARIERLGCPLHLHPMLRGASFGRLAANPDFTGNVVPWSAVPARVRRLHQMEEDDRTVHVYGDSPDLIFWPKGSPDPENGKTYIGFEFEAQRGHASDAQILSSLFRNSDIMNPYSGSIPGTILPRMNHLHVGRDSTVGDGHEVITMPHELGHPSTYEAMSTIYQTLMAKGAHNRGNCCGMHMHMSNTIIKQLAMRVDSPNQARNMSSRVRHVENVLNRFNALVLKWCESQVGGIYKFFTGRRGPTHYADVTFGVQRRNRRTHINWSNDDTLEFRWPGPNDFQHADWPNVISDICAAMIECTRAIITQERNPQRSVHARNITSDNDHAVLSPQGMAWAMQSLQRIIFDGFDQFPFAYAYFFTNPRVPTNFILI